MDESARKVPGKAPARKGVGPVLERAQIMKPHLSWSRLNMFWRCGEQYRRRYICGEKIPPGISAIQGLAIHAAIEENLRFKLQTGALLPIEAVQDLSRDALDDLWLSGIYLTPDEANENIQTLKGQAIDFVVRASVAHREMLAPIIEPQYIEWHQRIVLDGYPFDIEARVDIIEDGWRPRDTKSTTKSPAQNAAHYSDQLTLYCLIAGIASGEGITAQQAGALDHIIVSRKDARVVVQNTTRCAEDYKIFLRRFENACIAIEKGVFIPASRSDWICGPRWCGYAYTCPYYNNRTFFALGG